MINTTATKHLSSGALSIPAKLLRVQDIIYTPLTHIYHVKGAYNDVHKALSFASSTWDKICENFGVGSTADLTAVTITQTNKVELFRSEQMLDVIRATHRSDLEPGTYENASAYTHQLIPGDIITYASLGMEVACAAHDIDMSYCLVEMTNGGKFVFDRDFTWSILRPII